MKINVYKKVMFDNSDLFHLLSEIENYISVHLGNNDKFVSKVDIEQCDYYFTATLWELLEQGEIDALKN